MNRLVVYRNCFTGDVSGGDMHMSGLLGWLLDSRAKIDPLLVMPKRDGQEKVYPEVKRIRTMTHPDTSLKQSIALMYAARAFQAAQRVNKFVGKSDVLVASSHFLPDVLPVFVAHTPKQNKIVYIHHIIQDMDRPDNINTKLANLQEKLCFWMIRQRFGKVIVVNQDVADRLRQMGFRKQQILLSSNFVHPLSGVRPYAQKDITLAFCGRLVTQKGVDDFVKVCLDLKGKVRNFKAVMIGVGPEQKRLQQLIKQQNLPIELAGYVTDEQKFDILSRAKLFVFPSVEEGWGIAIAEALAVGTPVVAYDLPVYGGVFGENLHIVPLKDQDILRRTVHDLLQSYAASPADYQAEQQRIAAYADQFRVEYVAAKEYEFMGS
ncbi:MAG TPA: glycosyltransferase family 4 protein [Candidatus Saccharimonadales bacterium]|nr:glycosyltransferase family 4 protein [Candidatus Saccharimonadales bacterium]